MKDDKLYLEHILEAIDKVEKYTAQVVYDEFVANEMMADAVVRQFEIIGEACSNLSSGFRQQHPEISYRDIIDMRNVLIHNYTGVNLKIVWETCRNDLPKLKPLIETALSDNR